MRAIAYQLGLAITAAIFVVAAWIAGATAVIGLIDDLEDLEAWFWLGVALGALFGATWSVQRIRKISRDEKRLRF